MSRNKVLIVGCTGVNGFAVTTRFEALPDWDVTTLSRSKPGYDFSAPHIEADLLDPASLEKRDLEGVTHVFYAALKPNPDPALEASENGAMLRNLIDAVEKASSDFRHLSFLQGGKVYGAQLGVYKTPAKEDDSRHFPPNLYFEQEDFARARSADKGWGYTALRPDILIGHSLGSAMNLGNLIGAYGALCKRHGVAMKFPGSPAAYEVLVNASDADIVAKAVEWSFNSDAARNSAFNITNGDVFRWKHVWPRIADFFGLQADEPQPIELAGAMKVQSDTWRALADRHGLIEPELERLGKWNFGDFIFHVERDAIFDVNKARRAGFDAMNRNSAESLIAHLRQMRERKLIPEA